MHNSVLTKNQIENSFKFYKLTHKLDSKMRIFSFKAYEQEKNIIFERKENFSIRSVND